jgi:hypothetical protein
VSYHHCDNLSHALNNQNSCTWIPGACCLLLVASGIHSQCTRLHGSSWLLAQALVACRLTLDAHLYFLLSACCLTLDAPAPSVSSGSLRNILDDTTFFSPIDLKNLSQLRTYDAGSCSLDLIKYHIKLFLVIRISVYHMQRLELSLSQHALQSLHSLF